MRKALALLLALAAGGCAMPQTTQELRDVYKRQGTAANIDKYAVNRPFAAAFADVKANAEQCLNVRVTGGTFDGGVYYPDSATSESARRRRGRRVGGS